jgi:hypothetical protein
MVACGSTRPEGDDDLEQRKNKIVERRKFNSFPFCSMTSHVPLLSFLLQFVRLAGQAHVETPTTQA